MRKGGLSKMGSACTVTAVSELTTNSGKAQDYPLPIRVFSDLHLGHSGCLIEDVRQLRPLLEGAGTVVFNGDTSEERAENFRAKALVMMEGLRGLCEELGVRAVFLSGNHDPEATGIHYLDLCGGKVFVTHGDALFKLISPWSKKIKQSRAEIERISAEYSAEELEDLDKRLELTKRSCMVMTTFELEMGEGLVAKFIMLGAELWPPRRPWAIVHSWMTAPSRAHHLLASYRPGADVMIFGHTHLPGVWKKGGKKVINTGGFLAVLNARVVEIAGAEDIQVRKVWRVGQGFDFSPDGLNI